MRNLLILLFCSMHTIIFAQEQDSIAKKMEWYGRSRAGSNLFVHFDKNVYSNNETIWFTGYLINYNPAIYQQQLMVVALVRDIDNALVVQDRFLLKNGLSYGNLTIPDSLMTGDYHLIAFTNVTVNQRPVEYFSQPITIKTKIEPPIDATLKFVEHGELEDKILLSASRKNGKLWEKPFPVSYTYGQTSKQLEMGKSGSLVINLPYQQQLQDPTLYVKLSPYKESTFMHIPIPQKKGKAEVKFYPESGQLVAGISTTVGFEIRDAQHRPVLAQAFLYKNKEVIDTISTDSYGIGKFKLAADTTAGYTVKIFHSGFLDSTYQLPKAIPNGLALSIANAIVKDTLRIELKSFAYKKIHIRIHNFRHSFLFAPFEHNNVTKAKLPLTHVPKGIMAITITDSIGRPLAERLFFAHYDANKKLELNTDRQRYHPREKVTLELKLSSHIDLAMVSIACIQQNRILLDKKTDIENFAYINQELIGLPVHANGNGLADKNYLEQILLVKGWRKYNWQDLGTAKASDTTLNFSNLEISGALARGKKIPGSPVNIATMGNMKPKLILTENDGTFRFDNNTLLTAPGKKMYASVGDKTKMNFVISIKDGLQSLTDSLIKSVGREEFRMPSPIPNTDEMVITKKEKSISLREVVITGENDQNFDYVPGRRRRKKNECGDYVCSFGILNCPNHVDEPENVEPIPGEMYQVIPGNEKKLPYVKCLVFKSEELKYFVPVPSIHLEKEFYGNDYKDPLEPAYFSTIYWNYGTLLKKGTPTKISFYTSDISGKFKIIAQGLADKDVIYAEHTFEVAAK